MPASDITLSVTFTGTPNDFDKDGATFIVENENARRAADLDENGDPVEQPLPYATGAELKVSYLGLLAEIITKAHASYVNQAARQQEKEDAIKDLYLNATPAQRAAAKAALTA